MSSHINLCLDIEAVNGSDPKEVCRDMVALSQKLAVLVSTTMNGAYVVASPQCSAESVHAEWEKTIEYHDRKNHNP